MGAHESWQISLVRQKFSRGLPYFWEAFRYTLTHMDIRPEVLVKLLAVADDLTKLFGADGLVASLTARFVERVTEAELDTRLRAERAASGTNTRNSRTKRTLPSGRATLDVSMPRDRAATFEPKLVPKYLRHLPDFDEKVLLLYSRGMSTRDIQAHLKDLTRPTLARS